MFAWRSPRRTGDSAGCCSSYGPPALDEAGLAPALELFLTDAFGDNGFDWRVSNEMTTEPSPEVRAILYRVALEALTNVRKHANASLVEVLLERRGVGVAMRVRDDGDGFELPAPDAASEPGHIGLALDARARGGRRRELRAREQARPRHDRRLLDAGAERPASPGSRGA